MTRNEFIKKLKEALKPSLDKDFIDAKLDYYDKYISDEVAKGRNEKDVLIELGDPVLIAKTIKTVTGTDDALVVDEKETNSSYEKKKKSRFTYISSDKITLGCVIAFLVMFILVALIFRLLGYLLMGTAGLVFGFGPFSLLLIVLIVYFIFRRR